MKDSDSVSLPDTVRVSRQVGLCVPVPLGGVPLPLVDGVNVELFESADRVWLLLVWEPRVTEGERLKVAVPLAENVAERADGVKVSEDVVDGERLPV